MDGAVAVAAACDSLDPGKPVEEELSDWATIIPGVGISAGSGASIARLGTSAAPDGGGGGGSVQPSPMAGGATAVGM